MRILVGLLAGVAVAVSSVTPVQGREQRFAVLPRAEFRLSSSVAIGPVRSAGIRGAAEFQCTWDGLRRLRAPCAGSPLQH